MGLLEKIRGELLDIIEYNERAQSEILAYRFPRRDNEIKNGAKLVVREGQAAVFVNEGQIADVFEPGTHKLETANLPVLSKLMGWYYGFESPFKAEVYFVATRQWTDQKWGTQNPLIVRDPEYGAVRVRAFGTYAFRVTDPAAFLRQIVATDPNLEVYEISNQLRNTIVSRFSDVLGQERIPILDLAGNYERIGELAREKIAPDLASMGLALTLFYIENISLPPEVESALDKRTSMGIIGDMGRYSQMQAADALRDAAANPAGMAGLGAGLGAGVGMGGQMVSALNGNNGHAAPAAAAAAVVPPALPATAAVFFVAINNAQAGPFDLATLAGKVRDGAVSRTSLVWKPGMAQWAAAESVDEMRSLFASTPPPIPKKA
jgi:membrane protease subunit (stomatin/prohibitin family)